MREVKRKLEAAGFKEAGQTFPIEDSRDENKLLPRHRFAIHIDLSSNPSADSREVSDGVVLDYDEDGNLAGIDIDQASTRLDIRELILNKLPAEVKHVA